MTEDKHFIRRGSCILAFAVASLALYTSTAMNMDMSASNALTDWGKSLQAQAALVVHIAAAVFALLAGSLWRGGKRIGSALLFLLVSGFAIYSFSQVVGFGAKERIGKSLAEIAAAEATAKKAEAENKARLDERKDNLKWARDTVVKYTGKKSRGETVDTALKIMEKPIELQAVAADKTISTDVGVAEAAAWAGTKIEYLQLSFVALLSFLLIITEPVGFWLAGALWPISTRKSNPTPEDRLPKPIDKSSSEASAPPPPKPDKSHIRAVATGMIGSAEPLVLPAQKALPSPASFAPAKEQNEFSEREDSNVVRLPVRDHLKQPSKALPETIRVVDKARRRRMKAGDRKRRVELEADMALVAEFLSDETVTARHSCVQSDVLWKVFRKWSVRHQRSSIKHNRFGRAMTALKMGKKKRQRIYYCGIALRDEHLGAIAA
jgi:hypothetical protein